MRSTMIAAAVQCATKHDVWNAPMLPYALVSLMLVVSTLAILFALARVRDQLKGDR